jgi:hypothetical protein
MSAKYDPWAIPNVEEVEVDAVPVQLDAYGRMQSWVYAGKSCPQIGLNAIAGKEPRTWAIEPARYDDIRPGCYDPVERLKDTDEDGVWAHLCFPSFALPCYRPRNPGTAESGVAAVSQPHRILVGTGVGTGPDAELMTRLAQLPGDHKGKG